MIDNQLPFIGVAVHPNSSSPATSAPTDVVSFGWPAMIRSTTNWLGESQMMTTMMRKNTWPATN